MNLILLFLYAGMMLVNMSIHGEVRGGSWFAWSNLSRAVAMVLLMLGTTLPKFFSTVAGDVLLVVGLMLLHRSVAEVLGRGKVAWNLHFGLTAVVFVGVSYSTFVVGSYTASLILVSVALAIQMALTTALLFSGLSGGMRVGALFTGSFLFVYAVGQMVRAIAVYQHPGPERLRSARR